ncbi:glycoside hydrolase family 92 protein [Xylariaceae sp. FL1272]|nr:glycoside hydrolase family 92 protein [Xylariaceae sp. FL1272]
MSAGIWANSGFCEFVGKMRPYVGLSLALSSSVCQVQGQLSQYVLPSMGDTNGGNTFPGVSLPLGVTKLGPDLYTGSDSYSGYQPSGNVIGFSMLHESGTGGAPKYGVVSQMPAPGDIDNPLNLENVSRSLDDVASLGYYKTSLANGISVELSATEKAGLCNVPVRYEEMKDLSLITRGPGWSNREKLLTPGKSDQYTFPDNGTVNVVVDVSHTLSSYRGQGLGQNYLGGNISVSKTDSGLKYEGAGSYDNGWNKAPKWTVYFCGYFDQAATFKTFLGTDATGTTLATYDDSESQNSTARLGAIFTFDTTNVTSRVGVSFISSEQACSNVDSELLAGTSLDTVVDNVQTTWNDKVLSKITTTDTTNTTKLQMLYSSLYHFQMIPTNKTGENPLWTSSEPYYDDIFTFWDTFRCGTALLQVVQPTAYEEFIRSVIDIWRHEGFMPDARSSLWTGVTQGGSNADTVLADAWLSPICFGSRPDVKGVRGAVDWDDGFSAMVTDAEVTPENNDDSRDTSSSTKWGRGALPDWLEHGYITTKYGRSVSRAIEYAGNDFSLYQVAKGLGNDSAAETYLDRSRNWRNQWNPDLEALNFTGFLGPISEAGDFQDQDPLSCGGCYWADDYYEALPFEYSFNAHHDFAHLITLMGGTESSIARLEAMFTPGIYDGNGKKQSFDQFHNTINNPGNEPSFATPYLFNFVGRQDLSVKYSRQIAREFYGPGASGLPGNSDAGAMESWLLWHMIGLYPITGQTTFLIHSPWFSDLTIDLGDGKKLAITAENFGEDSIYVQSLKVNGENWDKSWLTWDDVFANGGTMDFVLGAEPQDWATGEVPPSPASA